MSSYPPTYVEDTSRTDQTRPISRTLFVGRTQFGPVGIDKFGTSRVTSWSEFYARFGAVSSDFPLSVVVKDYFEAGGRDALIYRCYNPRDVEDGGIASLNFSMDDTLPLKAAYPGKSGNRITATIYTNRITDRVLSQFRGIDLNKSDLFNLSIKLNDEHGKVLCAESFLNLASGAGDGVKSYPKRVDKYLSGKSNIVRAEGYRWRVPEHQSKASGVGGVDSSYLEEQDFLDAIDGIRNLKSAPSTLFNLLCIPADPSTGFEGSKDLTKAVHQAAAMLAYECGAIYLADAPMAWYDDSYVNRYWSIDPIELGVDGQNGRNFRVDRNTAVFMPRLKGRTEYSDESIGERSPCGAIAGALGSLDHENAPSFVDKFELPDKFELSWHLDDFDVRHLNKLGINGLRKNSGSIVEVAGAKVLSGEDQLEDSFVSLSKRRFYLHLESSLKTVLSISIFENNDPALWSALRKKTRAFLEPYIKDGSIYGFLVQCDATTTTPSDQLDGKCNLRILYLFDLTESATSVNFELATLKIK